MNPLVTIAISTYNRADGYLREALDSVVAQRYEPLEIIVMDNGSTDRTGELVAAYGDDRIRYVRHDRNIGANANFNACVDAARGTYFLLLHDDDRIDEDFVAHCIAALDRHTGGDAPGLIRTGNRVMDEASAVVSERANHADRPGAVGLALDWFAHRTSLYYCNTMFLTSALRAAGGFHSPRELYIDVAAAFRIAAIHPVLNVPEPKASFRRHGGNSGTAQSIQAWCEDSLFLIDLLCALAPARAGEVRREGLRYFARNNYARAARIRDPRQRLTAYWTVYRAFRFRVSPLRYVVLRWLHGAFGGRRSPSRA